MDSITENITHMKSQYQNIHNMILNSKYIPIVSDFDTTGKNSRMLYHLSDAAIYFDDNYSLRSVYYMKNRKSQAVLLRQIYSKEYKFMAYFRGYYIIHFESRSHLIVCSIDNVKNKISFIQEPLNKLI